MEARCTGGAHTSLLLLVLTSSLESLISTLEGLHARPCHLAIQMENGRQGCGSQRLLCSMLPPGSYNPPWDWSWVNTSANTATVCNPVRLPQPSPTGIVQFQVAIPGRRACRDKLDCKELHAAQAGKPQSQTATGHQASLRNLGLLRSAEKSWRGR